MPDRLKPCAALLAALLALPTLAQTPFKGACKELPAHPFVADEVQLTIASLTGYKAFDRDRKFSGRARVEITVENQGAVFKGFNPMELSFVGKDGRQVFPVFERNLADDTIPMAVRLAPGAHASMEYALTGRLAFPAKVYFGGALVAEVTE